MRDRVALRRLIYAALCLSLCYVLPFLTAGNRELGNALCLMHLPVLLCGLLCPPPYALAVGAAAPLLRSLTLGMPPLFPGACGMSVELALYGLTISLLYRALPKKPPFVYVALLSAMVAGRIGGGAFKMLLLGLGQIPSYSLSVFLSAYILESLPGIVLQIVLIPLLFFALKKAGARVG